MAKADVLVVDDTRVERFFLCRLLELLGVKADEADNGQKAVEMSLQSDYRLIFVDEAMPGLDGKKTIHQIKVKKPDVPVILLGENTGDDIFVLKKPVEYRRLTEVLQKYLAFSYDHYQKSSLEGILDTEQGVRFCGSEEGFHEALMVFYRTLPAKADEIEKYYNDRDWELYTIKVHALKSSSRIIGAKNLSSLAEELEKCGKQKDYDRIRNENGKLLSDYRGLYDIIGEFLGEKQDETGEAAIPKEEVPPEELNDAYQSMPEFIEQMDVDLMEMVLDSMEHYRLPEKDAVVMRKIRESLMELDWNRITKIIEEAKQGDMIHE